MRLILVGAPGSGKGTQARLLSERFGLAHIATGDILRDAVRLGTPAGQQAEPYLVAGQLVPDDLVNELVAERLARTDRPESFVMDGYPRTGAQAVSFDRVLRQQHLNLDAVVVLRASEDEIVRRITARWTCPNPSCKAVYHTNNHSPRIVGICDACGAPLVQRPDDQEATVRQRLAIYRQITAGMIEHYRTQGLVCEVNGEGSIERIHRDIIQALHKHQAGESC